MSIYQFTPGPLHVGTDEKYLAIAVKTANNEVICCFVGDFHITEDIGNAQLYAASPEMYNLLLAIRKFGRLNDNGCTDWEGRIDAVLAKARGESPSKEATL